MREGYKCSQFSTRRFIHLFANDHLANSDSHLANSFDTETRQRLFMLVGHVQNVCSQYNSSRFLPIYTHIKQTRVSNIREQDPPLFFSFLKSNVQSCLLLSLRVEETCTYYFKVPTVNCSTVKRKTGGCLILDGRVRYMRKVVEVLFCHLE